MRSDPNNDFSVLSAFEKEECVCGNELTFEIGTVIHNPLGKEIKIHNAPHYECKHCEEIVYNLKSKISSVVAYAYKNGLDEIDYREFKETTKY